MEGHCQLHVCCSVCALMQTCAFVYGFIQVLDDGERSYQCQRACMHKCVNTHKNVFAHTLLSRTHSHTNAHAHAYRAKALERMPAREMQREPFQAASAYDGSRYGYVFQMGELGLGYGQHGFNHAFDDCSLCVCVCVCIYIYI